MVEASKQEQPTSPHRFSRAIMSVTARLFSSELAELFSFVLSFRFPAFRSLSDIWCRLIML